MKKHDATTNPINSNKTPRTITPEINAGVSIQIFLKFIFNPFVFLMGILCILRLSPRSDNFYEKRPLSYYIPLLADYKCRNRLDPASDIGVPNESAWSCKNSLLAYSTDCGWQAPEDAELIRSLNVP